MTNLMAPLAPPPTIPTNPSFSGHETFAFRYAWLKKGVDGLATHEDIFLRDDAMAELGVGKNMVRSIRHWCLATRVVEERDPLPGSRARGGGYAADRPADGTTSTILSAFPSAGRSAEGP